MSRPGLRKPEATKAVLVMLYPSKHPQARRNEACAAAREDFGENGRALSVRLTVSVWFYTSERQNCTFVSFGSAGLFPGGRISRNLLAGFRVSPPSSISSDLSARIYPNLEEALEHIAAVAAAGNYASNVTATSFITTLSNQTVSLPRDMLAVPGLQPSNLGEPSLDKGGDARHAITKEQYAGPIPGLLRAWICTATQDRFCKNPMHKCAVRPVVALHFSYVPLIPCERACNEVITLASGDIPTEFDVSVSSANGSRGPLTHP